MKSKLIITLSIISFVLFGCKEKLTGDGDTVVCTTQAVPAIVIEVFDKQTGEAISCGATAIITDGSFSETVENIDNDNCSDQSTLQGAHEREGVYDIIVSKENYQDWTASSVEVSASVCHVNTITLQVYLEL